MDVTLLAMAHQFAELINRDMLGRIAMEGDNAAIMATYAAIPGDHLEIGTLHGGTAVLVALMKSALNLPGRVVCIDPLNGYYKSHKGYGPDNLNDTLLPVPVTPETVMNNARKFGVLDRIEIVQACSCPWPVVEGRRFTTAYIDGDHWGDYPTRDWQNCAKVTDRYIIFDNVDDRHPSVQSAVNLAISSVCWRLVELKGITAVMEKVCQ
jgi:hypothetical protein